MTALASLLNSIRQSYSEDWLMPSQRLCYSTLVTAASLHNPVVLLGPAGSGKTFLGWVLHRELGLPFAASPATVPSAPSGMTSVIIDNADLSHLSARAVLGEAMVQGWTTVVILARDIDPEGVPALRLASPTVSDISRCLRNFAIPLQASVDTDDDNMWRVFRRLLSQPIREGHDGA